MERIDRRVRRTHQLLGDALIALAVEKGYDSITIKDITERADVAYVTFFRHYKDKDDLLRKRLDEILGELEAITHQDNRASEGLQIFRHVQVNAPLYHILLENGETLNVRNQIRDNLAFHLLDDCEPLRCWSGTMVPVEVVANHIAVGLFGLIEWWLRHDMPYPPEQMAQMYDELILKPARAFHSVTQTE